MRLAQISLNNLRRRKAKALFSITSLALGVAIFVTLQSVGNTLQSDLAHRLDQYGANIIVLPKSDSLNLSYGGLNVGGVTYGQQYIGTDALSLITKIDDAESISTVSPKVIGALPTEHGESLIVGVDFQQEFTLKKWWSLTGQQPQGPWEVLLGAEAADKMNMQPGDTFRLSDTNVLVAGVLEETGSQDDYAIFLQLSSAQKLLDMQGKISLIEISALCTTCPIKEISDQIGQAIPTAKVTPLKEAVVGRMATTTRLATFATAISVLVIIISSLVVLATIMGSVNDRTREIGILRAIGFRQSQVAIIILIEAILIGLLGGITGMSLGYLGYTLGARVLTVQGGATFSVALAFWPIMVATLLAILASLPGVWKATRLEPVEAIRVL